MQIIDRLAGDWKIVKSENTTEYYKSIGVNSILARVVSALSADIKIIKNSDGFTQISTTNGVIRKSVEQKFRNETNFIKKNI